MSNLVSGLNHDTLSQSVKQKRNKTSMATTNDTRNELAELIKRKSEITVCFFCCFDLLNYSLNNKFYPGNFIKFGTTNLCF